MSRVAIFGGTFNPIHNGHILCANECMKQTNCDKVIFVPSNIPPHKTVDSQRVTPLNRFEMCKIALKNNSRLEVSDFEIRNNCVSYTVNTLEYFAKTINNVQLFLLIGQDMFYTLLDWENPMRIFELSYICIVQRYRSKISKDSSFAKNLRKMGAKLLLLDLTPLEISSTFIRGYIKSGSDVSEYLPYEVKEYIKKNNLYV